MGVLGFLAGAVFAIAITMFIVVSLIKSSNDWGDYNDLKSTVEQFDIINKANNVKESFSVEESD